MLILFSHDVSKRRPGKTAPMAAWDACQNESRRFPWGVLVNIGAIEPSRPLQLEARPGAGCAAFGQAGDGFGCSVGETAASLSEFLDFRIFC